MIIRCAPNVEHSVRERLKKGNQGIIEVKVDPSLKAGQILAEHQGDSLLDTGYIYAPYIPLHTTPTFNQDDFDHRRARKTPLQEAMEEIFKEEIESGELTPIWGKPQTGMLNKNWVVYKDPTFKPPGPLVNPDFFGRIDISNL